MKMDYKKMEPQKIPYQKNRYQKNARLINTVKILIIILCVVLLALYAGKMDVLGRTAEEEETRYYRELETRFTAELRTELSNAGFQNAGITVSSIIEPGLGRSYTVKIHHQKLVEMEEWETEQFLDMLSLVTFPDSACSVSYQILL